jgi:hypothetical protein
MHVAKDAVIRVYLKKECWESGLLFPFFEDVLPEADVPIYFRAKSCEFDSGANCYVFKQIPYLRAMDKKADVYIPKEFVYGISVHHNEKSSDAEMGQIGFHPRTKAAATGA